MLEHREAQNAPENSLCLWSLNEDEDASVYTIPVGAPVICPGPLRGSGVLPQLDGTSSRALFVGESIP
jgi:hypothetical protein